MNATPVLESIRGVAPLLLLRLLSSRGLPRQGVLALRPEGRGMADAIALAEPHLDDIEWRDFGGWAEAQPRYFADGGVFDQIYQAR